MPTGNCKKRPKFQPTYSGSNSEFFWAAIRDTNDRTLYTFACALQDIEARVLRELEPMEAVDTIDSARPATRGR